MCGSKCLALWTDTSWNVSQPEETLPKFRRLFARDTSVTLLNEIHKVLTKKNANQTHPFRRLPYFGRPATGLHPPLFRHVQPSTGLVRLSRARLDLERVHARSDSNRPQVAGRTCPAILQSWRFNQTLDAKEAAKARAASQQIRRAKCLAYFQSFWSPRSSIKHQYRN